MAIPLLIAKDKKYFKLEAGEEVENFNIAYIVGDNGLYLLNVNNGHSIIRPFDKDDKIKDFDELKEEVSFNYPVISFDIFSKSLEFCRQVYKEHKSEAGIILILNRNSPLDKQEYKIHIPKQSVGGASVNYVIDHSEFEVGEFAAGSIHSHPNFGAYQSSIDHNDEFAFDGPHITLGHLNRKIPQVHERLCLAGEVYEPSKPLIDVSPPIERIEIPSEWLDKIEEPPPMQVYNRYGNQSDGSYSYLNGNIIPVPENFAGNKNKGKLMTMSSKLFVRRMMNAMKPNKPKNQRNTGKLVHLVDQYTYESCLGCLKFL